MAIKVGDKAPSFTLVSADKDKVSLGQFEGQKVLLLFFPFAFSGTCTKELCKLQAEFSHFQNLNAQILTISIDSPFALKKFQETYQYPFALLSDFNKEASRAYDVLYDSFVFEMKGVAKRSAFIIDQRGLIRYAEVLQNADHLPDFAGILETLEKC